MGRRVFRCAICVALLLAALVAQPAFARESLFARSCVLPSDVALALETAELETGWICQPRMAAARTPHLWVRIDPGQLPAGSNMYLESDAMPFAGLTTVVRFADGSERTERFTPEDIVKHSMSATRFAVPLYSESENPTAAFVRIDKPFDTPVATLLAFDTAEFLQARELREMILFGVFLGMLLVIAIYSLSLSMTLKTSFGWFHGGMVLLFCVYTLASSSLIFLIFPGLSLWERTNLSYVSLALSMSLMAPFFLRFIEQWALTSWIRWIGRFSGILMAMAGFSIPILGPSMPFELRTIYHLAFVPGIATLFVAGVVALLRRSKAVRLVFLAWLLPLIFALERIVRTAIGYDLPVGMQFAFFLAMAYQALVMVFAIAWRVGEIRRERDEARAQERQLSLLAATDSLTGLPNRRAFDHRKWRRGDFLAVVDVDRFKQVNDTFGHVIGDKVLSVVGRTLAAQVGEEQLVGAWRLGGEEFAILVEAPTRHEASRILNRAREQLSEAIEREVDEIHHAVTLSAGLAEIDRLGIAPAYRAADRALYHAKSSGRDRLCYESTEREIATIFPRGRHIRAA